MLFSRLSDSSVLLLLLLNTISVSQAVVASDLDDLDKAEFNEAIALARECMKVQDAACVEKQLTLAKRRAGSSSDKVFVDQLRSAGMPSSTNNDQQQAANERAVIRAQEQRRQAVRQARIDDDATQVANQTSAADAIRNAGAQMNQQLANQLAEKQYARERLAETQRLQSQAQLQAPGAERVEPVRKPVVYDQAKPQVEQPVSVSSPPSLSAPKPVTPVKATEVSTQPEALAFCWQTKRGGWLCDGPGDETTLAEKEKAGQLSGVGCREPSLLVPTSITLTSIRVKKRGSVSGWLYRCGKQLKPGDTGHATWNRDIRRFWSGIPN